MSRINLFDRYYIETHSDDSNILLCRDFEKPKYDKKGKPISPKPVGYFSTFRAAIEGFRRIHGRELIDESPDAMNLSEAIRILTKLDEDIEKVMKDNHIL